MSEFEIKSRDALEEELCNHCTRTEYGIKEVNSNQHNMCEGSNCEAAYEEYKDGFEESIMKHKRVIFSKPATIVIWEDGTKTIVKCNKKDKFKKTVGFLMAYFQKTSGMTKHKCSETLRKVTLDNLEVKK